MPRGKNCVGEVLEGNVWASEKYIMTEVFDPSGQLGRAVSGIDTPDFFGC